ncbi:MAG: hypothetical protein FD123_563 [Bacteroidetes bacterium]|nr:MAG: hypothetical protein FD123_563 [Bacteroidota bacterium]
MKITFPARSGNKMSRILFLLSMAIPCSCFSQVLNGGFENGSGADLSYWEWTCNAASFNSSPPGGGNWCMKVTGGNMQGCFPGYSYQKIPSITNGQTFILSGWAFAETSPIVGIYFGKINNGIITMQAGSTTASASWTQLSVQSGFVLSAGDTAVVILYGGLVGGPGQGYGYFDLINLEQVTGVPAIEQKRSVSIFPIPFSSATTVQTDEPFKNATLTVYNFCGQATRKTEHISGQMFTLYREDLLSGVYFFSLTEDNKIIIAGKLLITDN